MQIVPKILKENFIGDTGQYKHFLKKTHHNPAISSIIEYIQSKIQYTSLQAEIKFYLQL